MSIANQITRIQNEVTTQEDLIAQITAALQGKASGGLNIETCFITFPESITYNNPIYYLAPDLTLKFFNLGNENTIEVIKNSILTIGKSNTALYFSPDNGIYSDKQDLYLGNFNDMNYYLSVVITNDDSFYFTGSTEVS